MFAAPKHFRQLWVQYSILLLWKRWLLPKGKRGRRVYLLCVARKKAVRHIGIGGTIEKYHRKGSHRRPVLNRPVNWRGYFLNAQPKPAVPHWASPLMFSQILAKRHCYNKQLRTCHTDGPFRDILAAGRRSTRKVLEFLSALNLRLWFWYILSSILRFSIALFRNFQICNPAVLPAPVAELR